MTKVLFLNTYFDRGGAAVSCKRIFESLQTEPSLVVKMLVHTGEQLPEPVKGLNASYFLSQKMLFKFALDRLFFLFYEKSKSVRFAFSQANIGEDISRHPWVQEADILHIHWINFGFLSLDSLQKLLNLGKPIVWTMHDMWVFTGGCHYAQHCRGFEAQCGGCFYLRNPHAKDLSHRVLAKKNEIFSQSPLITFVGSSQWLVEEAKQSSFFKKLKFATATHIMTPIDISLFKPADHEKAAADLFLDATKFRILFGAVKINDERKGIQYFQEAIQIIQETYPEMLFELELVLFGKTKVDISALFPISISYLGILKGANALIEAYSAAHVFVLPSLDDNLPNTIIESMACATPVVAFRSGGIPEMIDHRQNGYLADYKSSKDLAEGLHWVWARWKEEKSGKSPQAFDTLRVQARQKALDSYHPDKIRQQYLDLYQKLLNFSY
ncbi:MAG: glycosyltransferase [Microscillaceae bacterium]|nr:glycosyltransferase [Microscillaceae bacterium]